MFYLTYLWRELTRRRGRTILTALGMGVGIALVVAITALSAGLDRAQDRVLYPLSGVATDLMVTRTVQAAQPAQGQAGGLVTGQRSGGISPEDEQALLAENQSVLTDLSQLGKPGDKFAHDFFLPATQLTFASDEAASVASIPGVVQVARGLTLLAVHQEGTVPQIVAEFQTGGETFVVERQIPQLTDAERAKVDVCVADMRAKGQGPNAIRDCLPDRFRNFRTTFTTPQRTITQVLNPPQTDIKSETYTIAGVDTSTTEIGLITPAQIAAGRYFGDNGDAKEAILAAAYAQRKNIALGAELDLNGTKVTVVGFATPPLGGQVADVYLPLEDLQQLAKREGRINVMFVRASDAAAVGQVGPAIQQAFPAADVTSAKDLAARVNGSLVDAANLADRLGLLLAGLVLAGTFAIASLLTLSSVAKRVRELGTLKALGWGRMTVVRQVVMESVAQSALGGAIGAAVGIGAAAAIAAYAPPLQASVPASAAAPGLFGLGTAAGGAATTTVPLEAPVDPQLLLLAVGLGVAGGLIAGAIGGFRTARLRPAVALRELG